jgi:hypothetical protein
VSLHATLTIKIEGQRYAQDNRELPTVIHAVKLQLPVLACCFYVHAKTSALHAQLGSTECRSTLSTVTLNGAIHV